MKSLSEAILEGVELFIRSGGVGRGREQCSQRPTATFELPVTVTAHERRRKDGEVPGYP